VYQETGIRDQGTGIRLSLPAFSCELEESPERAKRSEERLREECR
jgi:hypothetical protein